MLSDGRGLEAAARRGFVQHELVEVDGIAYRVAMFQVDPADRSVSAIGLVQVDGPARVRWFQLDDVQRCVPLYHAGRGRWLLGWHSGHVSRFRNREQAERAARRAGCVARESDSPIGEREAS